MATIGTLVYLGSDPYGGAVGRHEPTLHLARVPLRVDGPRGDGIGLLASALHVAFYLRRNPDGHTVKAHREHAPGIVRAAEVLLASGADRLAQEQPKLEAVLERLLASVTSAADRATRGRNGELPAGPAS